MDVDIGDINKLKKVTGQFKDGLPVLHVKARVSKELIVEKIEVSRQAYNAIETGKRDIPWTTFPARLAFLNNNQTRRMINQIDGFEKNMTMILNLPKQD